MSDLIVNFKHLRCSWDEVCDELPEIDLIVDFKKDSDLMSDFVEGPNLKSVGFSPQSEMKFIESRREISASSLWYSEQDYEAMKRARNKAACNLRRKHSDPKTKHAEFSKNEDFDQVVGIENLLSPEIARKTLATRSKRLNAVLDEQTRQSIRRA
ncbi:hypothetical protein ACHAWF_016066 [Thalassiosira exigua]